VQASKKIPNRRNPKMLNVRYLAVSAAAVAVGGGAAAAMVAEQAQAATARPAATAHQAQAAAVKLEKITVSLSGGKNEKKQLLVSSKGRPVYLLTGDSASHPLCTSASCLGFWPPLTTTAKKPALGAGIKGKLTVWHHKGMSQLMLNGHPLYMFASDSAGTASGQGKKSFGGTWDLLTSSGSAFSSSSSSGGSSGGSGGGSGSAGGGWS